MCQNCDKLTLITSHGLKYIKIQICPRVVTCHNVYWPRYEIKIQRYRDKLRSLQIKILVKLVISVPYIQSFLYGTVPHGLHMFLRSHCNYQGRGSTGLETSEILPQIWVHKVGTKAMTTLVTDILQC
jgi:hypothetical protein